jgi:hypothetical protein
MAGVPVGWTHRQLDGTTVWGHVSGLTAESGYSHSTGRRYVLVQGEDEIPSFTDCAPIVRYLADGMPVSLVPGLNHGYNPRQWMFMETTDSAVAGVWALALREVGAG